MRAKNIKNGLILMFSQSLDKLPMNKMSSGCEQKSNCIRSWAYGYVENITIMNVNGIFFISLEYNPLNRRPFVQCPY